MPSQQPSTTPQEQEEETLRTRLLRFENLVNDLDLCGSECGEFTRLPAEVMANIVGCLQESELFERSDLQALACTNKHFYVFKDYYATLSFAHQVAQKEIEFQKFHDGQIVIAFRYVAHKKYHPDPPAGEQHIMTVPLFETSSIMLLNAAKVNHWRASAVKPDKKKSKKASGPTFKQMPDTTDQPQPSSKLIATDLPEEINGSMMLMMLFQQYPGLQDINPIPSRKLAFIQFANVMQASTALEALKGFMLDEANVLNLTYAKE